MNRPQVQSKVHSIICSQLSITPDQLTDTTNFENDLKADSLDITEIGMSLEDEFQITIEDSVMERIKTVGDAVYYICEAKGIPLSTLTPSEPPHERSDTLRIIRETHGLIVRESPSPGSKHPRAFPDR